MKLSIIIVNYNVKFFLEQCLLSVRKAIQQLSQSNPDFDAEIIVVDNNSVDSSTTMLCDKFPDVKATFIIAPFEPFTEVTPVEDVK